MAVYQDSLVLKDKVSNALNKINKNFDKTDKVGDKAGKSVNKFQRSCVRASRIIGVFNKKLQASQDSFEQWQKRTSAFKKAGESVTAFGNKLNTRLTLPIIAAGGAMTKLASDMQETINKVEVSFGSSTKIVTDWAKTSIKTMGLAQQSALDSAALYGDMATGMGFSQKKAAEMATSLTQLGADLASFKNISNDVAQTALKSIFTGETESLKGLGIVMTETNLQQFGLRNGMLKMVATGKKGHKMRVQQMKDLSQTEQVMLRYKYVMAMTANAQGDFERTGGGAANQTRMFQENLKEIGVTFGTYLLPYFTKAIIKINELLVKFGNLSPETRRLILIFAGVVAAIGPLITILDSLITSILAINIALYVLESNPVALTIMGWTAVFAGLVAGIWAVIKAIQTLVSWLQHLQKMRQVTIDTNFNQDEINKLSKLQASMGDKAFTAKYGKDVNKKVTNYRKTQNTTTNTYNTFSGNITLSKDNQLNGLLLGALNTAN